jgi:hypothetical protein
MSDLIGKRIRVLIGEGSWLRRGDEGTITSVEPEAFHGQTAVNAQIDRTGEDWCIGFFPQQANLYEFIDD